MKMSDEKRRELRLESQRRYRERNAALIREKARKYREANREAQKERHRKWWEANKDKINARAREQRAIEKQARTQKQKPIQYKLERTPRKEGEVWIQTHNDKGVEYEVKWVAKICKCCHKLTWQHIGNKGLCFDCFIKEYSKQFRKWIDWRIKASKIVTGVWK